MDDQEHALADMPAAIERLRDRLSELRATEGTPHADLEWLRLRCNDTLEHDGRLFDASLRQLRQDVSAFEAEFPGLLEEGVIAPFR